MDAAIYSELTELGFSEHEARIFVALTTCANATTAYELAKMTQMPVANTYNVIRSLERRGACRKVQESPVKYVAAEAREFLADIADQTTRRCNSLIEKLEEISPPQEARYVDVLKGREEVSSRIVQMIDSAVQLIVLKFRVPFDKAIEQALGKAIRRGVSCYVIYYDGPLSLPDGDVHLWPHEGNGIHMGKDFCMLTADSRQSIAFDAQTFDAAYSENDIFVYLTDVLLRHEIYMAEIMLTFRDDIERRFGPALHNLRERYALVPLSQSTRDYVQQRKEELKAD